MSLTFDQRASIVERLTSAARVSPPRYRLRVLAWIVFGYVIIATIFALALAMSVGAVIVLVVLKAWVLAKVIWIPMVTAFVVGRSLFVRVRPPQGRVLQRGEAPRLFAIIDEIRDRLRVAKLDDVLLTTEMNASIVETPRFGGFLGWRRHLIIGVPLLITASPDELKAILAHEIGHLSGQHGRIAAWSWGVRLTWSSLLESIDRQHSIPGMRRLMHWYAERLMLVTLVLARRHEHAADEASAELTTPETAARALAWVEVATQLMSKRHWDPLWQRVTTDPEAPQRPFDELRQRRATILAPPFDEALNAALGRKTALDDTHPALRARLQHLGILHPALGVTEHSAIDEFFGAHANAIIAECDREWHASIAESWKSRHAALTVVQKQIEQDDNPQNRADGLMNLGREDEALPIYQQILADDPHHAHAAFQIGRILVGRGDLHGLDHLRTAMRDWRFASASCELAYSALREKGFEKDAHAWAERHQQEQERIARGQRESGVLHPSDDVGPTTLSAELQEHILERCRAAKWVGKVWIGRKNLESLPTSVDFVAVRAKWFRIAGQKHLQKLAKSIEAPATVFLVERGRLISRLNGAGLRRFLA